jgi:UDP-3-O-[3-hydroxymyristoyl] glucosamine N-acyltransferase
VASLKRGPIAVAPCHQVHGRFDFVLQQFLSQSMAGVIVPMEHPGFFAKAGPFTLDDIARAAGGELADGVDGGRQLTGIKPLADAGPDDLTFFDNRKYLDQLKSTRAGACIAPPQFADRVPIGTSAILTKSVYPGYARTLLLFYPEALWSKVGMPGAPAIDPTAQIEDGVMIEPGAVIGAEASIGRGSRICAGAVVGYRCTIGRGSYIGAGASVIHSLIGDRVIIHPGAHIGQDGFGFAMGRDGHQKVPQVGRVIIQNDVEIGAGTTIDRGALKDTIIGEGSKIDNLVQIGHNVIMGRHCVIVGQTGIAGSVEMGDFVVMGGQSGAIGHIKIGSGAQIAGGSHPTDDVAPGARLGGTPAKPFRQYARELAAVTRLAQRGDKAGEVGDA